MTPPDAERPAHEGPATTEITGQEIDTTNDTSTVGIIPDATICCVACSAPCTRCPVVTL